MSKWSKSEKKISRTTLYQLKNPKQYPNLTIYIDKKVPIKFITIVSTAVWNAGITQIFSNHRATKIHYIRTVQYFRSIFSEREAQMIGLIGKTNNKG